MTTTMATTTVGLIPNWFPPNREHYELILSYWQWFPVVRPPLLVFYHGPPH